MSQTLVALNAQIIEPIRDERLPDGDSEKLLTAFNSCTANLQEHLAKAKSIKVETVDDKIGMQAARETRLHLKNIRVEVEKRRKELKEDSLRYGRAIDGVANILKQMIEPAENYLLAQEEFAIEQERIRLREIAVKRASKLIALDVDTTHFNLSEMTDEAFAQLLNASQIAFEAKKKQAEQLEAERIAKEKAEQEERERVQKENEELKRQQQIRDAELEAERKKLEEEKKKREEIERKAKEERDARNAELARIEDERIQKEKAELKAKKQAELAPDKEKLLDYATSLQSVTIPTLKNEEARAVLAEAQVMLNKVTELIRVKSIGL